MFLVVCSQISAKRLSLLVSHKQRAAFYPNGFRGRHHHGGKVTVWMSEGQIVMLKKSHHNKVKRVKLTKTEDTVIDRDHLHFCGVEQLNFVCAK